MGKEEAILIGIDSTAPGVSISIQDTLDELEMLVNVAGGIVIERFTQKRKNPDPATYIGKGKVEEIAEFIEQHEPDIVVLNNELTFVQIENLETRFECKVIDRSELILDIFASRARSHQARLSVELAQLEYQLPRLKRMWTHLSRMEGGIGVRGPGEKQLETDRRLARKQIQVLKRKLQKIEDHIARGIDSRSSEYTVALVGYTNTGKSTLMRNISGKDVLVRDELFATIDTRTARVDLGNNNIIILSDTVGFIDHIPHNLIESFKATLLHARTADILLHVIDSSSPMMDERIVIVEEILEEIGCAGIKTIKVFNKIDQASDNVLVRNAADRYENSVIISALNGDNVESFKELIKDCLREMKYNIWVDIPLTDGKLISMVQGTSEVHSSEYTADRVKMEISASKDMMEYLVNKGCVSADGEC